MRAAALLRSRFLRLSDRGLATLAPRFADAILDEAWSSSDRLDDEDARVLSLARRHVPRWLDRVDRVPPAEVLDTILTESAYAYELRGARRAQAWENLKKVRGLVRRIQNRGYATFPRIAAHLDSLTAGDESNAVLEAIDAVNLMTVHASKGLEFPIVFVVNMAKGASGPPRPVRVIVDADTEEDAVSVGPFVSEMDEIDRQREKHETRRLLYVALTRARDRIYLSSVLKGGVLIAGRGSLAEVLPQSMKDLLAAAGAASGDGTIVRWESASGRSFDWRVCDRLPESKDQEPRGQ
jgi:ATP-dependent exoDNAse (exonuclease V) beta subunit